MSDQDWPLVKVSRSPAATYCDGRWWAVIETNVSGVAPTRLMNWGYSSHGSALAHARSVVEKMLQAAERVLDTYKPIVMEEPHD